MLTYIAATNLTKLNESYKEENPTVLWMMKGTGISMAQAHSQFCLKLLSQIHIIIIDTRYASLA